jgi:hypothetical protein
MNVNQPFSPANKRRLRLQYGACIDLKPLEVQRLYSIERAREALRALLRRNDATTTADIEFSLLSCSVFMAPAGSMHCEATDTLSRYIACEGVGGLRHPADIAPVLTPAAGLRAPSYRAETRRSQSSRRQPA